MIEARDLTVTYDGRTVLRDVCLTVPDGGPTLNMSLVVQATAWRMLPRTAKFRLLLGF